MKHIFRVLAMIAVLSVLSCAECWSAESAPDYKQQILQAKKNDEAELRQWQTRRNQLDLAQTNNPAARRFTELAKPNEDPTNVTRFSSAPSDYSDDVAECEQHIAMLSANIEYYDQELKKIEQAEKAPVSGDQEEEDFKLDLDLNNIMRKVMSDLEESNRAAIKSTVEEYKKSISNQWK